MLPNRTLMALKKETHLIRVSNCWCRCGAECNICKLTICKTQPDKKVTRKRKEKDKCVEKITWKFNGSTTMAEEFGKDPSWILGGNCRHSRAFITPSTPSCLCCPQCSRYPLRFVRYRTNHLPRWFGGYIYIFFVCVCITPGRLIADLRVSLSLWFPTPMPAGEDGEMGGGRDNPYSLLRPLLSIPCIPWRDPPINCHCPEDINWSSAVVTLLVIKTSLANWCRESPKLNAAEASKMIHNNDPIHNDSYWNTNGIQHIRICPGVELNVSSLMIDAACNTC